MSGSALAELCEALGELGEALYIEKLPINRPSGRYVIVIIPIVLLPILMYPVFIPPILSFIIVN